MQSDVMIEGIRRISEEMAVDASNDLDASVEHCPGWLMRDLVAHIGSVQQFWVSIVEGRHVTRPSTAELRGLPNDADAIGWFREQTHRLTTALHTCADDVPVWTWFEPQQNALFVKQRQLIEVAVHGWDARNAVGDPRPISAEVATVGLQEFVDIMALDIVAGTNPPPITLRATDVTWAGTIFSDVNPRANVIALDGTASDLLLTLWNRKPIDDPAVARALAAVDLS
jgi:uncharacterized protein (TIGR03083 family)